MTSESLFRRVAVVMVTYRSAGTVLDALRALPLSKLAGTIVVDNASDDGTVAVVRDADLPQVTVLPQRRNLGFGTGSNRGVIATPDGADLVLFLNPDAVITAGALHALVAYLDRHPSCGLVAPRLTRQGAPLASAGRLASTGSELRYVLPAPVARRIEERRYPADYARTGPVPVVEGAAMLVRLAAFRAAGGFDETQFLYFEEHQLARALTARGFETHLLAEVTAEHLVGVSTATLGSARQTVMVAATLHYLLNSQGRWAATCYRLVAAGSWWLRARFGGLPEEQGRLLRAGLRDPEVGQQGAHPRCNRNTARGERRRTGAFVSWMRYHGRSADLAARLELPATFHGVGRLRHRPSAPFRYSVQALRTTLFLLRHRPTPLVVMAPPDLLVFLALIYGRVFRARVVVDAHSAAVRQVSDGAARPSFAALCRRCNAVIVTNKALAEQLPGANVFCLDDPVDEVAVASRIGSPPLVVLPAGWAPDEPWPTVIAAARLLPDVAFRLTGRPPAEVRANARAWPSNVTLTGPLPAAEYERLLGSAGVVLALTTREATMQRAGYEALARARPLVASDTAALRDYFGNAALYTPVDPHALAGAIKTALDESSARVQAMATLRDQRSAQFDAELHRLRAYLAGP